MMLSKPESCQQCPGWAWGSAGFVPADGDGSNGCLCVLEAAGAEEAEKGIPTVGKAGAYLWNQLNRASIDREGWRIHNVLSCQPGPKNLLAKMPYESAVINHCAPNLDATIYDMHDRCAVSGKTFTILALGKIAFKRIMGIRDDDSLLRIDYYCYPIWNERYRAWVVAAPHPSFLMRGNNHLTGILQFAAKRALEIAAGGFAYDQPTIICDPEPVTFQQWIHDYLRFSAENPKGVLAFDIETPYKKGADETAIKEDNEDYTILRCSFAYRANEAISVPWRAEYKPLLEELFSSPGPKVGHNSDAYDLPRIQIQMPVHGDHHDTMLMWHVLNSALPKGLGFITPYYWQATPPWKHTADAEPARYNGIDSLATLRCFYGIHKDLTEQNLAGVYDRHVVDLNRVLTYMSDKGVCKDEELRNTLEAKLTAKLDAVKTKMEAAVPVAARRLKIYKKLPKELKGLEGDQLQEAASAAGFISLEREAPVKRCSVCQLINPKKAHFKPVSAKKRKLGLDNVCEDAPVVINIEKVLLWAKPLEWKVSKLGLTAYQKVRKHRAIMDRRVGKSTFDVNAIEALMLKYPNDPLYKLILEHRSQQKLCSVYVGTTQLDGTVRGGLTIGRDGKIHTTYTHNPSTLRLASQDPNLQQIPSRSVEGREIKNLIVASPGCRLVELDFSAIEAVLVGYFAGDPSYIRLAKMGIHSYLASFVLERPANLKWSDADLIAYFKEIKKSPDERTHQVYQGCKRAIHMSGYGGSPHKMVIAEPDVFPDVKYAEKLQGMYFELFPLVRKWQFATQMQAEKDGFLRNPFNYVHRFNRVFSYEKIGMEWKRKPADDANKVLAFLPQSTAAGLIKEAMLRLYESRFEAAGQYLRLQIHDSLLSDVPEHLVNQVLTINREEMTRPVPELRLPASYGMGDALTIGVDAKVGVKWGELS